MSIPTKKDLRIIFIGTPDFAVASLKALVEDGYNIVGVITTPDRKSGRGKRVNESAVKQYATSQNLNILQPEKLRDETFITELKSLNADLQIVVAFRMLPKIVWNMPPMGTINVHGSLLPDYRGAAPINWAIINGATETGVTTFRLLHKIDTGNILLQRKLPILPEDNFGTLYYKLMSLGAQLLLETIKGLLENSIEPTPQDELKVMHHAPKLFKEDGKINWNQKAENIRNLIRGLTPIPSAYTFLNDKFLKIYDSKVVASETLPIAGTIDTDNKTYLRFACQDAWLYALEVQLEGKKSMPIVDFLRGYRF